MEKEQNDEKNQAVTLLSETIKTIKDNTTAYAEMIEILKTIKDVQSKLVDGINSKANELIMNDLLKKVDAIYVHITAHGKVPEDNAVALSKIITMLQDELSQHKDAIVNITSTKLILDDLSEHAINNTNGIALLKTTVDSNTTKIDDLSTWSKIKFPFIIGMISFILWLASFIFMTTFMGGWIQNKIEQEITPTVKELKVLNDHLLTTHDPTTAPISKPTAPVTK
jgi:hypothetical protein